MNYIIYLSTAVEELNNESLAQLLLKSRIYNRKVGITGMLLYNKGSFFQVLEGEEQQLNLLFDKLKSDARHRGIIKLKSGSIMERNFPDWSMGFKSSVNDPASHIAGFINPAKQGFLSEYNANHPAINLLRSFVSNNNFAF